MGDVSFSVYRSDHLASTVHSFLVAQALHLKEGRVGAVARAYSVPLIVSLPGVEPGYIAMSSRAAIEHFFQLKYEGLQAAGIPYLRVRVTETRATAPNRMTVMAEWHYLAKDGQRAGQTTARYFLERRRGAIAIHMVEFERVAFPALADWFREAGTEHQRQHRILH